MIFKQFFQPKWKHPKASVRVAALSQLNVDKDINALQSLASDDPSNSVRLAALKKLDSTTLWWRSAQLDDDTQIKQLAKQRVGQAVVQDLAALPSDDLTLFLKQYANDSVLEQVALNSDDLQLQLTLLRRLQRASLVEQVFRSADEAKQAQLLELVFDLGIAKRVLKSAQGQAKAQIDEYFEQQRLAEQMPEQVATQARMVLAKLKALKDKADYSLVSSEYASLVAQFKALETSWLDADTVTLNEQKFAQLCQRAEQHIKQLEDEFEQAQAKQIAKQRSVLALANLEAIVEEIRHAMMLRFDGNEQIQTDWLHKKVEQAKALLAHEDLQPGSELEKQRVELTRLFQQVGQLTDYEQSVEQLRAQLDDYRTLSAQPLADDPSEQIFALDKLGNDVNASLAELPDELAEHWQQQLVGLKNQWQQKLSPWKQSQQRLLTSAQKKCKDLHRLMAQGRYRVAFGVFNGLNDAYEQLSAQFKKHIENEYQTIQTKLSEAQDWHQYAGQAQQESLSQAAQELAEQPCDDIQKRVADVKRLRKSWQLLGPNVAQEHKERFEQALEQAFAPAREHFAKREQENQQAIAQRQTLIEKMRDLAAQSSAADDIAQFDKRFNQLNKAWRTAARVDGAHYAKLKSEFDQAQGELGTKLAQYYKDNAAQKEALLAQAKEIDLTDLFAATNTLKSLQQQWQQVGYAGSSAQQKLWQAFREVNDKVFALRDEQKAQQQAQEQSESEQQAAALKEIESALATASPAQVSQLHQSLNDMDVLKANRKKHAQLLELIKQKQQSQAHDKQAAKLEALMDALTKGEPIPAVWLNHPAHSLSAEQLLLRLELAVNCASPEALSNDRMVEQVAMLDDKHQGVEFSVMEMLAMLTGTLANEAGVANINKSQLARLEKIIRATDPH